MQGPQPRAGSLHTAAAAVAGKFVLPLALWTSVLLLTAQILFQPPRPTSIRVISSQSASAEGNLFFRTVPMPADEREGLVFHTEPLEVSNEVVSKWLRANAPVFAHPEHDVRLGHALVKVFYFLRREVDSHEIVCQLIIVYEGEGSYRRKNPLKLNALATFFYMSYNRLVWGRTADLDYLTIYGVDLNAPAGAAAWKSIRSIDGSGNQTWSQGNKGNLFDWLSLFYHYRFDVPRNEWEIEPSSGRPIVYVNTADHLMGATNANPQLALRHWHDYPLEHGGREGAELFARTHVCQKPVLWNPWPKCANRCKLGLKASRKEAPC